MEVLYAYREFPRRVKTLRNLLMMVGFQSENGDFLRCSRVF